MSAYADDRDGADIAQAQHEQALASGRPNRPQHASGTEVTYYNKDHTRDYVMRQVGWIGQSGDFYSLDEDPSVTERGGFSPLLFCAHSDRVEPSASAECPL